MKTVWSASWCINGQHAGKSGPGGREDALDWVNKYLNEGIDVAVSVVNLEHLTTGPELRQLIRDINKEESK